MVVVIVITFCFYFLFCRPDCFCEKIIKKFYHFIYLKFCVKAALYVLNRVKSVFNLKNIYQSFISFFIF